MFISPLETEKDTRTIVFSFNEKYAKYFSVVLISLTAHAKKNCLYDLIVLHDSLSEQTMAELQSLVPPGFVLRFFHVGACAASYFENLPEKVSSEQWDLSTFYDLLIPLIMPDYERVLYCDSDIVFCADPEELFALPFESRGLIAVQDTFSLSAGLLPEDPFIRNQKCFIEKRLGIANPDEYFNAGVLLFNIPAIEKDVYIEKVRFALTFPELPTVDQDVLNYVFLGNAAYAPLRFNLQVNALNLFREKSCAHEADKYREAADNPVIIHYATPEKPWRRLDCSLSEQFWSYAVRSPFYEQILRENICLLKAKKETGFIKYVLVGIISRVFHGKWRQRFQRISANRKNLYRLRAMLRRCGVFLLVFLLAGCASHLPETPLPVSAPEEQGVAFSCDSGVYMQETLTVALTAPAGCTVAFTTNGEPPSFEDDSGLQEVQVVLENDGSGYLIQKSNLMSYPEFPKPGPLDDPSLPSGKVLRAAAISPSGTVREVKTNVYFLNVNFAALFPECLVISIVTDPANLLDYETGILTPGAIYDEWKQTEEAAGIIARHEAWFFQSNITQRGKAWERPCLLQIFDGESNPAIEQNAGIRITGNASRVTAQKSFNVFFRDSYGSKYLDYKLFTGIDRVKSFRLRAGGNNTEWLKFKDAFLLELVSGRNFMETMSRPAVLFLNGEYWGPYLLSEKVTDQMLADHCGIKKDQVILFKEGELEEGTKDDILLYEGLMSYAKKDLTDPAVWQKFCEIMDIQSMADYCAARIYFGDADWRPDKNDMLWRTRDRSFNEGRWQYILYDVEFSSGMYEDERTAPETDHFRLAKENYPLFAAAVQNQDFYILFLNALKEIGAVNCEPGRVERLMEDYLKVWMPLMPDYYKRFGDTKSQWDGALATTTGFFQERYDLLLPLVENGS